MQRFETKASFVVDGLTLSHADKLVAICALTALCWIPVLAVAAWLRG